MLHLDHAYQKSITHLWEMQRIFILLCDVCNLLEYSVDYSVTSRILYDFYRDEINDDENENDNANNSINNNKTAASKFFEYKTKIIIRASDDNNTFDIEVVVLLKYLSKFMEISRFAIDLL